MGPFLLLVTEIFKLLDFLPRTVYYRLQKRGALCRQSHAIPIQLRSLRITQMFTAQKRT